jgi:iron-sulfur cluster repair protein YtfE (RIC family)
VVLRPVPGPPRFADGPGGTSGGAVLRRVHDGFRRELALIRDEVGTAGDGLGAQLRMNCLTVCVGLHRHHTGEDLGMFRYLAEHRPELAATIERLRREHEQIAALVEELQAVLSGPADSPLVLREIERLTDELERHLDHEEEQLVPVLDAATT